MQAVTMVQHIWEFFIVKSFRNSSEVIITNRWKNPRSQKSPLVFIYLFSKTICSFETCTCQKGGPLILFKILRCERITNERSCYRRNFAEEKKSSVRVTESSQPVQRRLSLLFSFCELSTPRSWSTVIIGILPCVNGQWMGVGQGSSLLMLSQSFLNIHFCSLKKKRTVIKYQLRIFPFHPSVSFGMWAPSPSPFCLLSSFKGLALCRTVITFSFFLIDTNGVSHCLPPMDHTSTSIAKFVLQPSFFPPIPPR